MSALVKEQDSEDIAAIFTVAASDVFFLRAILRAGSFTRKRYIGNSEDRRSVKTCCQFHPSPGSATSATVKIADR
jgi:hypothetical protein